MKFNTLRYFHIFFSHIKFYFVCIVLHDKWLLTFPSTSIEFDPHAYCSRMFAVWYKSYFTRDKWKFKSLFDNQVGVFVSSQNL